MAQRQKTLFYISGSNNCQQDLINRVLEYGFGLTVMHYMWIKTEPIKTDLENGPPDYVIVSEPFGREDEREEGIQYSCEELWDLIKEICPDTPILWLSPDMATTPTFLPVVSSRFHLLPTADQGGNIFQDFLSSVSKLTGIRPKLTFQM